MSLVLVAIEQMDSRYVRSPAAEAITYIVQVQVIMQNSAVEIAGATALRALQQRTNIGNRGAVFLLSFLEPVIDRRKDKKN
jgi:hypothetical protein